MDYNTVDKIIDSLREHPIRTLLIIFILALIAISAMFLSGYLSEIGKGAASDIEDKEKSTTESDSQPASSGRIEQQTEGAQSPAVVSGGNANIQFGDKKND